MKNKYFLFKSLTLSMIVISAITVDILGQEKDFTYYGTTHRKLSNGKLGPPVRGVDVQFTDSRSGLNVTVRSKCSGYYTAKLPRADYKIKTRNPAFVVVVRDRSRILKMQQKFEIKQRRSSERREKSSLYYDNRKKEAEEPKVLIDSAPIVIIHSSQDTVKVGEAFSITVTANDQDGVHSMWWYATYSKSRSLSEKHIFESKGKQKAKHTWTISIDEPGLVVIGADAKDIQYDIQSVSVACQSSLVHEIPEVRIFAIESFD